MTATPWNFTAGDRLVYGLQKAADNAMSSAYESIEDDVIAIMAAGVPISHIIIYYPSLSICDDKITATYHFGTKPLCQHK